MKFLLLLLALKMLIPSKEKRKKMARRKKWMRILARLAGKKTEKKAKRITVFTKLRRAWKCFTFGVVTVSGVLVAWKAVKLGKKAAANPTFQAAMKRLKL